ncbi:hypothetical protein DRQ26_00710 [bacterium]|nr:MAG: hypothetical protein DRQ26_00710 [bacterium]
MDVWKILAWGFAVIILLQFFLVYIMIQDERQMCENFCEYQGKEVLVFKVGYCMCTRDVVKDVYRIPGTFVEIPVEDIK